MFSFSLSFSLIYTMGAKELLTARVFVDGKIAPAVQGIALLFQIQYLFSKLKEITMTLKYGFHK